MNQPHSPSTLLTLRWIVTGRVQGVGFRPFVYRLAREHGLAGWVRNLSGQVEILGQGEEDRLHRFEVDLIERAPAIARPRIEQREPSTHEPLAAFTIEASSDSETSWIHVPPDYFACPDCLAELRDPSDRRHRYPFNNCTQCGPRYSLIRALPYDRAATTMAAFRMCEDCEREYTDPGNRRFHAEPIACPKCGPWLSYHCSGEPEVTHEAALEAAAVALRRGDVLAVKGVGGYHLMCDAANHQAIARLRERKPRPHKPLAVLFPDPATDSRHHLPHEVEADEDELALLQSPQRPIVLLPRTLDSQLPDSLAPGLGELGVMLPYSPLHALLLDQVGGPLVATSANISGEPVLTDNAEVETRLSGIADAFLHHNRPIQRPADDAVFRPLAGRPRPLRLGRGSAPLELELPQQAPEPLLAVGAQMKNTIALAWDRRLVISPHIGDMGSRRSLEVFAQVVADLQALYGIAATRVLCDAHPDYTTHRWARDCGLPMTLIPHHQAHASALYGEHGLQDNCLVFTWDGTGYGEDGTLWGGETLYGRPGHWQRLARMRPFHLPGGDRAGREPWRAAAALCWESDRPYDPPIDNAGLLYSAWQRRMNTPRTSAVGRLFDAAASLTGLIDRGSYEGQGPMLLEQAANGFAGNAVAIPIDPGPTPWQCDWSPLLVHLLDHRLPAGQRAADFHASLARLICDTALKAAETLPFTRVGLTGGVFQNRLLIEQAHDLLQGKGFSALIPEQIPCNDAAISAGQIYAYIHGSTAMAQ